MRDIIRLEHDRLTGPGEYLASEGGVAAQSILQPWQLLLCILAGWVQREQQAVFEYLRTENQVLREHVRRKRLVLTDDQRQRLAVQGRILGRKRLAEFGTLFTPDTILRWHRLLVARKWDTSAHRSAVVGRPRVEPEIVELVLRLARENPSWGYDRIVGAVKNLGFDVSDQTVGNILREHGETPAPDRRPRTTWKTFLLAHWDVLAAIDFTTVEVWTRSGLVTFYRLFAMELTTRRVHFAGCTASPHDAWMKQTARELTSAGNGFLEGKQYLIMDRDTKFSAAFRDVLTQADVESVVLPPRSPNLNAHLERCPYCRRSDLTASCAHADLPPSCGGRQADPRHTEYVHQSMPGHATTAPLRHDCWSFVLQTRQVVAPSHSTLRTCSLWPVR